MSEKLTKEQVEYVDKSKKDHDCSMCRQFCSESKTCSQVEGAIAPEGGCSIYSPKNPFEILGA